MSIPFNRLPEYTLYHLSFNKRLGPTLNPRQPASSDLAPKAKPARYTETDVARVSFSPTIDNCFRAIYPNIASLFEDKRYPHIDVQVYLADGNGRERILYPETLTQERMVWDAHVTQEHLSLDPIRVKHVGVVRFFNPAAEPTAYTHPYNDPKEPKQSIGPAGVRYDVISGLTQESQSPIQWTKW